MSDFLERCASLASPSIANFIFSLLILFGILGSYVPQHYRIISRRSSEGLSPYFVLLGATSGSCAIANILLLPTSRQDMGCCRVNDAFPCIAGLLGIAQVGVQWSCFFLIMFLFLVFIPRNISQDSLVGLDSVGPGWLEAVVVVSISMAHFLVIFLVSVVILARYPQHLQIWANVLGIMTAVLASIQYLPQIWTTWSLKRVGSLSIPMMCIQTPGSFVWAGSLAARLGPNGWSAWAVYVLTGTLQGCLLVMGLCWEYRAYKEGKASQAKQGPQVGGSHAGNGTDHRTSSALNDEVLVLEEDTGHDEQSPLISDVTRLDTQSGSRYGTYYGNPLDYSKIDPDPSSPETDNGDGETGPHSKVHNNSQIPKITRRRPSK